MWFPFVYTRSQDGVVQQAPRVRVMDENQRERETADPTIVIGFAPSQLINTKPPWEKENMFYTFVHYMWGPGRSQNRPSYSSCIHLVENWFNLVLTGKFVVKCIIFKGLICLYIYV